MKDARIGWMALVLSWLAGGASATQSTVSPVWTVESNQIGAGLGSSVSGAGDVNGDGFDDVIVCAYAFGNDQYREGRAYVFLGRPAGPAKLPSWTFESDQAYATTGPAAGAGDVNGDGYSDVIVGANLFDNGQRDEGRAFLFLGAPRDRQR